MPQETDAPHAAKGAPRERPLSPHLQIYRPQLTTVLSILHRATGLALSIGTLLFTWWLVAAVLGPDSFACVQHFMAAPWGLFLLLGWSWSLFYHLLNGLRHLAWDAGHGYSIPATYRSGWLVVVLSFALTALALYGAYRLGVVHVRY